MNTRFYNARILTLEKDFHIIENGELWVQGETISYVGTGRKPVGSERWDREIDAKGNLLMPGFKNAHTHSAMTFLRSNADDMELMDWLNQAIFPYEAKLTAYDIYYCTCLAVLEYLTSGITAVCEMYLTPDSIARAFEDTGMRNVQCGGMNNFSQSIAEQRDWFKRLNSGSSLSSYRLGIHAEYTCDRKLLEETAALAQELKAPVYLHLSETEHEVGECIRRYGRTPAVFLDSLGFFNYGGTCFHGVHVTDEDIEIFKKRDISIVTNPSSNTKLASGIAPISRYLDANVNLAIGTDGPASNNCLDMFREMFLTTGLAKLKENDASAVPADKVLWMATRGGAKAMGLSNSDCLKAGKNADLIMIDLDQPNMRPLNHIVKNLVYSGSKQNVAMTMINGKILYENGNFHIGMEPSEIYEHVEAVLSRIKAEVG